MKLLWRRILLILLILLIFPPMLGMICQAQKVFEEMSELESELHNEGNRDAWTIFVIFSQLACASPEPPSSQACYRNHPISKAYKLFDETPKSDMELVEEVMTNSSVPETAELEHTYQVACSRRCKLLESFERMGEESFSNRSCEKDVCPYLEKLTSDAISRTTIDSSYGEGRLLAHADAIP